MPLYLLVYVLFVTFSSSGGATDNLTHLHPLAFSGEFSSTKKPLSCNQRKIVDNYLSFVKHYPEVENLGFTERDLFAEDVKKNIRDLKISSRDQLLIHIQKNKDTHKFISHQLELEWSESGKIFIQYLTIFEAKTYRSLAELSKNEEGKIDSIKVDFEDITDDANIESGWGC